MERRAEITAAYQQAADCPFMIMTLGVAEVWFDTVSGYYVNVAPRPSHLRAEPDRFEMHILSFDDAHDYLDRTVRLLQRHGHPALRISLTVSPVPLTATHRDEDVIVANCYSKSALRTVAETICARYDFVTYFPSYQSVTLSDRRRAWWDDFVHVTDEMVALNVGRMVDAFIEAVKSLTRYGRPLQPAEKRRQSRRPRWCARDRARRLACSSPSSVRSLPRRRSLCRSGRRPDRCWRVGGRAAALENAPGGTPEPHTTILRARILVDWRVLVRPWRCWRTCGDGKPRPATFWTRR